MGYSITKNIKWLFVFAMGICAIGCSDQDNDKGTTSEFIIETGNSIQNVASAPLVQSPIAMTQDNSGRLWVVEMPGYMRDIDGNGEDISDGRIVLLSDKDVDGIYDDRKVIIDSLLNPRAILLAFGGVLYTDGNSLVFGEIEGDKVSNKTIVDPLYVNGGNIEHQPNGLYYNIDNWIYNAKSKVRYQYSNGKWIKEATSFRGQWGMSADDLGRLVYNHNSVPILGDVHMPNTLLSNPYLKIEHNIGNLYTQDMSVSPFQATSVNRGYEKGVLDDEGKLRTYTSSCAPHVYYGDALGATYDGNIFVCAPEINAISRFAVNHERQSATKVDTSLEFLVSKDETFRPVNLATGYDDCLYVVDLRKGIIQHSAYMSSYLREKIVEKDLEKVSGIGNIYRIKSENHEINKVDLPSTNTSDLVNLLSSNNITTRLYAQRQIIHLNSPEAISELEKLLTDPIFDIQNLHALWTLDGLGKLKPELLLGLDPNKIDPRMWTSILPLISKYSDQNDFSKLFTQLTLKQNSIIDIQLAPHVGNGKHESILKALSTTYGQNIQMAEALITGVTSIKLPKIDLEKAPKVDSIWNKVEQNIKSNTKQAPTIDTEKFNDTRTNGLQIFRYNCASCHGMDGGGQKLLAPGLTDSKYLQGPESELVEVIFLGYDSGKDEYQIKMPAYIENNKMSDQDVSDLIDYLLSTFARRWGGISADEIGKIRSELKKE